MNGRLGRTPAADDVEFLADIARRIRRKNAEEDAITALRRIAALAAFRACHTTFVEKLNTIKSML